MQRRRPIPPNLLASRSGGQKAVVDSGLAPYAKAQASSRSTSDFLRQMVTANSAFGRPKRARSASNLGRFRPSSGVGTKQPEDLQEELMTLKRTLVTINNENVMLKTKLRKFEDSTAKKEQELENLLDPSRANTLHLEKEDRLSVNSLKQKILRLEQSLRYKESALNQLKSDLKTTKIEEIRHQMDIFYNEILRLQRGNDGSGAQNVSRETPKELAMRLKTMNDTILKQNETCERLQHENKTLRLQLDSFKDATVLDTEYKNWPKSKLVMLVSQMEKELEEHRAAGAVGDKGRVKQKDSVPESGKLQEILETRDQLQDMVRRLKDEKLHYKQKLTVKEKEIAALKKQILLVESNSKGTKPRKREKESERRKATKKGRDEKQQEYQSSPELSAQAVKRLRRLREHQAARTIQGGWRNYKHDRDLEEAADVIGSAARGHRTRKQYLDRHRDEDESEEDESTASRKGDGSWRSDSGIDDAAFTIQSAGRAHLTRKKFLEEERRGERSRRKESQWSINSDSSDGEDEEESFRYGRRLH